MQFTKLDKLKPNLIAIKQVNTKEHKVYELMIWNLFEVQLWWDGIWKEWIKD